MPHPNICLHLQAQGSLITERQPVSVQLALSATLAKALALETVTMPDGFKNKYSQPNSQKRVADLGAVTELREGQTVPSSLF